MKRVFIALIAASFAIGTAMAQETCDSKAVGKDGKPLAGAAKTSFLKKCKQDACEGKAVGSDGKKLSGAAKNSFMTKCQAGA
jgi:predicted outer membrane lipoprotein